MKRFLDEVVVITGAAGGIGFAIAQEFASEGAHVIILDLNKEIIDKAVETIGDNASGYVVNVTDYQKVEMTFKEIHNKFGKIDCLINNAVITRDQLILRMKEVDWDLVLNVNLKGTFICTQKVIRFMMKKRKGCIINISSIIGIIGNAGQANYAASKGGMIAFTKSTAKEFASRNIRVNAIAPGFIETDMTKELPAEVLESYSKSIPMKKPGQAKDVANLCKFLASEEAGYITGQTINVDGGLVT